MFTLYPGDSVYAIVNDISTFKSKIVSATVRSVGQDEIVLERTISDLVTVSYAFPKSEWDSIFQTIEEAESTLYDPSGESWRKAHGLASPPKKEENLP